MELRIQSLVLCFGDVLRQVCALSLDVILICFVLLPRCMHMHPLQEDEFAELGRSAQKRHAQEVAPAASTAARRLPAANPHLARGGVSSIGGAGDGVTLAAGAGGAPHVPRVLVQFCVS